MALADAAMSPHPALGAAAGPGLFEPTEGRGPEVPIDGLAFVWGVDVSSLRLSIAIESEPVVTREGEDSLRAVFSKSFTRPRSKNVGERLRLIYTETFDFASAIYMRYQPEQVSVESPAMGRGAEPILEYATGAVCAALYEAAAVPVWMVPVGRWKLRAIGKGNATKTEALEWASGEFGARTEDEADAAGVARAAVLTVWGGLCDEKDLKRGAVPRSPGGVGSP